MIEAPQYQPFFYSVYAPVVWRSAPFAGVRLVGMLAELHKCLICAVRFGKWVTLGWGGKWHTTGKHINSATQTDER